MESNSNTNEAFCGFGGLKEDGPDPHEGLDPQEWCSLSNLVQLIELLPRDAWEIRDWPARHGVEIIFSLVRSLSEEEVSRCKLHAGYIEKLGYGPSFSKVPYFERRSQDRYHLGRTELEVCQLRFMDYPVLNTYGILPLPNLRTYLVRTEIEFLTINLLAGPRINRLEFGSIDCNSGYPSLSGENDVAVRFPSTLRVLYLRDCALSKMAANSLSYSLSTLTHLEILHLSSCEDIKADDFTRVFTLKTMQELSLGLFTKTYLRYLPLESDQKLLSLQVTVKSIEDFVSLLAKINTSELRVLKFKLEADGQLPLTLALEHFFASVSFLCNPELLVAAEFWFVSFLNEPELSCEIWKNQLYSIKWKNSVAPLFKLKKLQKLCIYSEAIKFRSSTEIPTDIWPKMTCFEWERKPDSQW